VPPVALYRTETLPPGGAESLPKEQFGELLEDAREHTLGLVDPVCDEDLDRVHDLLMSPLAWDLGHIGAFEDLWVCRAAGLDPLRPELMEVYDAAETPRAGRGDLPYLPCDEAREYMQAVRDRALSVLEGVDLSDPADPLNRDGFVWEMLVQHEHQHNETMLQTLALAEPGVFAPARRELPRRVGDGPKTVHVEEGPFTMGDSGNAFAYDNERPDHDVTLEAFEIDRLPVTNADYSAFVEDGGYYRPELWTADGWRWREEEGAERPLYWTDDGRARSFERIEPLDPALPVMHVCWFEADAFSRWRGARLPTEAEWEKAASWNGSASRYPWGEEPPGERRANLDQLAFGPAPAGAYPEGASPSGALGMLGDQWEWTASEFRPYPGFRAFPYREYSEIFFGPTYKVLRGGSWATRSRVVRCSFRNWDYPERRQIFSGFRCARDR
jgi:gamma-glutamyl hercynylcysteine S-oxide synthase